MDNATLGVLVLIALISLLFVAAALLLFIEIVKDLLE